MDKNSINSTLFVGRREWHLDCKNVIHVTVVWLWRPSLSLGVTLADWTDWTKTKSSGSRMWCSDCLHVSFGDQVTLRESFCVKTSVEHLQVLVVWRYHAW